VSWIGVRQGGELLRDVTVVSCDAGGMRVTAVDCAVRGTAAPPGRVCVDAIERGGVLLVVAAGGRSTAVVEAVVRAVRPELVVVCVSRTEAAFSGPAALVQMLARTGIPVATTADGGSVRVEEDGDGGLRLVRFDGARWAGAPSANPARDARRRQTGGAATADDVADVRGARAE